jgi:hypothetical protein
MRSSTLLAGAAALALGCATRASGPSGPGHVATVNPAATANSDDAMGGGGGGGESQPEHDPEIVRSGKSLKLGYADAAARYGKGARCSGADAPEAVIGPPDQRNQMQQAKTLLVTYGYRFREGTLLIRCRADKVELQRTLK